MFVLMQFSVFRFKALFTLNGKIKNPKYFWIAFFAFDPASTVF